MTYDGGRRSAYTAAAAGGTNGAGVITSGGAVGDNDEYERGSLSSAARRPSTATQPQSSPTPIQGKKKKINTALDLKRVPGIDILADKALIAYLKIIAEINRNKQVLAFRTDSRLTLDDTQQYKVRMGFGLHVGWAIEGAVGSDYKVDATYLSPHVNLAARLETASKQYGVPLLFSQVCIATLVWF